MPEQAVTRVFQDLYSVCQQFMGSAPPGTDIRHHGLTHELLERCRVALEQTGTAAQPQTADTPHQDMLPPDLQQDGWQLYNNAMHMWYAHHPAFDQHTAAYPTADEAIIAARMMARPY